MKDRLNITVSPKVRSLLLDHERYGYTSQSAMIEAAIEGIVNPLSNTPEIQRSIADLKEQIMQETRVLLAKMKIDIDMDVWNQSRTAVDQYIEEIDAARTNAKAQVQSDEA